MYNVITNCHGIVVAHTGDGGGSITSDLHEKCPICESLNCYRDCPSELAKLELEDEDEMEGRLDYNKMMDALESIILAHSLAGIDITTPAYMEGIETACNACAKATE